MEAIRAFFGELDIWQILSSFIFLIAIIDPFGNIPVTIAIEKKGFKINAHKVCIASLLILMAFLFLGEWILKIFGVQIEHFAIAGGFIIFLMALEMILDITIFQNDKLEGQISADSSIVPLAFPMYAGPGAFTALLAITAEGQTSLYIIRKFFGIIVLAIACKLMFGNLATVFHWNEKEEPQTEIINTIDTHEEFIGDESGNGE